MYWTNLSEQLSGWMSGLQLSIKWGLRRPLTRRMVSTITRVMALPYRNNMINFATDKPYCTLLPWRRLLCNTCVINSTTNICRNRHELLTLIITVREVWMNSTWHDRSYIRNNGNIKYNITLLFIIARQEETVYTSSSHCAIDSPTQPWGH